MKVRRLARVKSNNGGSDKTVVWFGSYGKDENGHAKFFNKDCKHDNFAEKQQYVADDLTQKLSIIENELWWNINYGLPLIDKLTSKQLLDNAIMKIILSQNDVEDIKSFTSSLTNRVYHAQIEVQSSFGLVSLEI